MTLATKITIARILLIVPTMIFYIVAFMAPNYTTLFLILTSAVFIVLCLTDIVDGAIARKTNTVTDLGKFLDPLADKVVVVIMMFLILWQGSYLNTSAYVYGSLVFSILSGIVLSRELIIGIFRAVASQKGLVLAADFFGKIKTDFLDIGVAVLILAPLHAFFMWFGTVVFYIGAALAAFSGIHYMVKNKQVLNFKSEKPIQNIEETDKK